MAHQKNKSILIICYSFPPFPGVGGRRWAKFAKYLAVEGYTVHAICSENPFDEKSAWTNDVQHENIKIHQLPINYPRVMYKGVNGFADKVKYKLWKLYFSIYSKGVVFERTMFWKKQLLNKASDIIEKEGIKNVIATIPPYRLAVFSVELKKKYPDINFIVDYRDPWTDNKSFHGFKNITDSRYAYEQQLEREVIEAADIIVSVSEKMTADIKAKSIGPEKVVTIVNGYDPSDIGDVTSTVVLDNKIRFIYGGSLYNDLDYVILPLIEYLKTLKENNTVIYNRLSFEFYGSINKELKDKLMAPGNRCITVNAPIPLPEMQKKLKRANFGLLITPPDYSVVFNTKFCEYLANRRPVLLFTYPCDASEFLNNNKLGFHINPANIVEDLDTFFNNIDSIEASFNKGFNIEPFSVPYLTTQIEKLLK